ncbi:DNRLRE domain-containing protein [Streptomyces sp. PSKA01]|uniref:DNRLRE domain-containing protein n=2 Tax=Streptomyces cupreus TaxID=2759956 RepID=A0A7X1JA59_9ACTN|nr:DNRLRE domain-containing protein [Streptomyces cupreus]MBC2906993.1 DNRLRE domain-containing protein [Streptomyces cupreus]
MAWAAAHAKGSKAWAILEAKKTGKKVVAPDETTATSYTVANPDGTLTTELTPGPERVWRGGKWHKVDAALTTSADGTVRAKEHPNGLRLAGKGGTAPRSLAAAQNAAPRDLVTLGSGEEAVTLQWKGGLPAPELDGTTARYREAVPGADVIVEATRTGFEQFVEINQRPSGAYSYTLPVRAKGLKAKANEDGSVTFTDAETGRRRATMPAPVMWDASVDQQSGEHTRKARVAMKVVNKGTGRIDLVVTPSTEFLSDPATRYPVTVDPSTSALASTFDTYVQRGETVDLSTDTELDFGNPGTTNADGTTRVARSFIHWNTTPIQDALIIDTNLALWNFHSGNTDCTAQSWTIWDTTAASTSSRWTNQPTWNQQYHSSTQTRGNPSCTGTQPDGWINADVDALVQTWASAQATRGFMGLRAATDDTRAWKRVNSGNNTANQPKLSVTYNYRPSDGSARQAGTPFKSYAGVWAVDTTTPTLRDTFTDADGDTVNGTFQVYDAATNTPITTPLGEGLLVSDFGEQGKPVSVVVPAGQLQDGKTYKFRTNAYDGTHYNLNWSPWTEFVVDTTAPGEPSPVTSSQYPEGGYGGGAGQAGTWTATTADDANRLQYRVDGEDPDPEAGVPGSGTWTTVNTTSTTTGTSASFTTTPTSDGAHHVDTRAVDRADNVGTTSEYGFIAGTAPAPRSHKVDITLNAPATTAADPADWNNPYPAFGWNGWNTVTSSGKTTVDAPPLLSPKKRVTKAGDVTLTMTPQKQRSPQAAKALKEYRKQQESQTDTTPFAASSYTGPVLDTSWCDPTKIDQKSFIRRTEACLLFTWGAEGTTPQGVYRQYWDVMWQVKLDPKSDTIKTFLQMYPLMPTVQEMWPSSPKAMAFNVITGCGSTGCTNGMGFDWETGRTPSWSSGLDQHIAQGTADFTWDGSVTNAAGLKDKDLSKVLTLLVGASFSTDTPNMVVTQDKVSSGPFEIRCDKVYGTGGCVVPSYSPGYSMNSKKFPAAAAHTWLIQNRLAPEYFGQTPVTPLHYMPNKTRNAAGAGGTGRSENSNRYRICYGAAANRMVYRNDTALHPELSSSNKDRRSCDEYSFNATYESAGMPTSEGGLNPKPVSDALQGRECVQTYEKKLPDGTYRLYDDERYAAPTWDETCGRSSMSLNVNSQSMARFGSFASTFRLLDKDTYWVDIDGFQDCDATADVIVCAQRP